MRRRAWHHRRPIRPQREMSGRVRIPGCAWLAPTSALKGSRCAAARLLRDPVFPHAAALIRNAHAVNDLYANKMRRLRLAEGARP